MIPEPSAILFLIFCLKYMLERSMMILNKFKNEVSVCKLKAQAFHCSVIW